jgi:hypothetical protein
MMSTLDDVEAHIGNVLVEGKRMESNQADDDNQPIPQKQVNKEDNQLILRLEPEPTDNIDRPNTPHMEEDSIEVEIHKPVKYVQAKIVADGGQEGDLIPSDNDPISTKNNDYVTNSFLEGGAGYKTAITPATNEISNEKLLLAQPEEQGKSRGKDDDSGEGEDVDKAHWGMATMRNVKGNPKFPYEKPEGQRKVNPKTMERCKVNSEERRHEVCPSTANDAKSIQHPYINQINLQSNAKSISTLMDLENFLLKGQHLPTIANMATAGDIHYQEDPFPLTHTQKSYAAFSIAIDAITHEFLEEPPQVSLNQFRGGRGFLDKSREAYEGRDHFGLHET